MPKLYLKYAHAATLGIVASGTAPVAYCEDGKQAVVPALESCLVWDLRKGESVAEWNDSTNHAEVTAIERGPNGIFAVGYNDGSIRLWETATNTSTITFTGHKTAVTSFAFSTDGSRLASGSKDTDLVVWDTIGEVGLFRLRGHKDQITGIKFITSDSPSCNHLVSASKDSMLKFWDLGTRHCVETVIAHRGEVWALETFDSTRNDRDESVAASALTVITGGSEGEVRVWNLDLKTLSEKLEPAETGAVTSSYNDEAVDRDAKENDAAAKTLKKSLTYLGLLERQSKERVLTIKAHDSTRYLVVQGSDRIAEIYKIRTQAELRKREARLRSRKKDKPVSEATSVLAITDKLPRISAIRCGGKIRSIDVAPSGAKGLQKDSATFQIICGLTSNQIEVHTAGIDSKEEPTRQDLILESSGHRNDIRSLCLSSDDTLLLSGSHSSVKLWNVSSRKCLSTMESGYALCSTFVPGNNHVIVGTKTGELQIFNLASFTMIESIQAHDGAVWSLQMWPDRRGITTGSADKEVKFWEFALQDSDAGGKKKLTLSHTRTLKLSEDVLCVRHSHDGKLLAVSLLDCTVKVFYVDTLKFSLSLYGHSLPVLSMDISSDGTLIATGSADKSVKLWGLDFGDCHRSLRAHDDSVMAVRWVFGTHYLVTAGKDRNVKWWDADKFEQIMKIEGHHGEIWALAVGKYGSIVVTGSHDRSIRIWEKTDEQFAIEEERKREMEEMFDKNQLEEDERGAQAIGSGVVTDSEIEGPSKPVVDTEVGNATRKTIQTMLASEQILNALEIYEEEKEKSELDAAAIKKWEERKRAGEKVEKPKPEPRNPYIIAANLDGWPSEAYLLYVIEGVRSSDLEQALLVLPFLKLVALLKIVCVWIEKV
ncbi:hypothetical protein HDU84_006663 [Entophlyctis sp. JEL0112]|nr:hypothetical protein HDU84_006663 [Entophlyctis sp. JEL0112]